VEFKSDNDLALEFPLTRVEESILSWYKWYTKTNVLKRTVERKIPEKFQLLRYPELRNLIHNKYKKKLDVKKIKITPISESESESGLDVKLDTKEEQWGLCSIRSPIPAQDAPPHDEPHMECAQEHVAESETMTKIESDLENDTQDAPIDSDRYDLDNIFILLFSTTYVKYRR